MAKAITRALDAPQPENPAAAQRRGRARSVPGRGAEDGAARGNTDTATRRRQHMSVGNARLAASVAQRCGRKRLSGRRVRHEIELSFAAPIGLLGILHGRRQQRAYSSSSPFARNVPRTAGHSRIRLTGSGASARGGASTRSRRRARPAVRALRRSLYRQDKKVFVDRIIAYGGATGGFLLTPNDVQPPRLEKEFPAQAEFDEKEILPES